MHLARCYTITSSSSSSSLFFFTSIYSQLRVFVVAAKADASLALSQSRTPEDTVLQKKVLLVIELYSTFYRSISLLFPLKLRKIIILEKKTDNFFK